MLKRILLFCFLHFSLVAQAQDSILQRVILIGNAGQINSEQESIINFAIGETIEGKTTVLFLGDNIMPQGFALNGGEREEQSKKILQSQYEGFRNKGIPVYFIPGDHDWDDGDPLGLKKVQKEGDYLASLGDSLLKLLPEDGCPDPVSINFSDSLAIIIFDSEWWLYQFDKNNIETNCLCESKQEVADVLEDLLYKNRHKVILLVSHHPFQDQGHYGGHFPPKFHLFPLTMINKQLYLPMPVIGSLVVLYKMIFNTSQDIGHPLYKKMIKQIEVLTTNVPNVIHVSGHERGMQFIKDSMIQVITGINGKHSFLKKSSQALYLNTTPGYVTADLLIGNSIRFTYYLIEDGQSNISFSYTQPYKNVKAIEDSVVKIFDKDSIVTSIHPAYNDVSKVHRFLFGENYRKIWSANTTLPVLKTSEFNGGLIPMERGGGQQTHSLRLKDSSGKEWALRSIEKYPEGILPEPLKRTFVKTWLTDAISNEFPYGSLMVPVLADVEKVPHSNPTIVYVAPDSALGRYNRVFSGRVFMIEEREPLGESENTFKMLEKLDKNNDNSIDQITFFRARLLDLFMGDWDRHEKQWGWVDVSKDNKEKVFLPVPKDRDQVFMINEGVFPTIASRKWIQPRLRGFKPFIKAVDYSFFNGKYLNSRFMNELDYDQWMNLTHEFVTKLTDSVLEASLQRLPREIYDLSHEELLTKMKQRRSNMEKAMSKYYYLLNKVVDINCSDKNEKVKITDTLDKQLLISIYKISDDGVAQDLLYRRIFDPSVTKQIRLYTGKGDDSVLINNKTSPIKLRIVGGKGKKYFNVTSSRRKVTLYEKKSGTVIEGKSNAIIKKFSNDSLNTAFVPTNRYNVLLPQLTFGYNLDDGVLLGTGFKYIYQGFRKTPYAGVQQLVGSHSFSTLAFFIKYRGEWLKAFGKADFIIQGSAFVPHNTQNYFGSGNETSIDRTGEYRKFYRARFNFYNLESTFRWKYKKGLSVEVGPAFQYYQLNPALNKGRFIENVSLIHTYDSTSLSKEKIHGGLVINFEVDKRSNALLPVWGMYLNLRNVGYIGLNNASKSFAQVTGEVDLYKSVNASSTIVIAERVGGTFTIGHPAFYQTAFLGGRENLMGYHKNRFSGQHMIYNNLELRIKLADFASYIVLPGQLGLIGFYDVGRVWEINDSSHTWHNGVGGGIYFSPASIAVFRIEAGYSNEGWYPYASMGFRF